MINYWAFSFNKKFATCWDRHGTTETDNFAQKDSEPTVLYWSSEEFNGLPELNFRPLWVSPYKPDRNSQLSIISFAFTYVKFCPKIIGNARKSLEQARKSKTLSENSEKMFSILIPEKHFFGTFLEKDL